MNLLIDPYNNCPCLHSVLPETQVWFFAKDRFSLKVVQSSADITKENYGLVYPNVDLVEFPTGEFDTVAVAHPFNNVIIDGEAPHEEAREFFMWLKKYLDQNIKYKYLVIFDYDDRAKVLGHKYLQEIGFHYDLIFKREYRTGYHKHYDSNVVPFPHMMFGHNPINAAYLFYNTSPIERDSASYQYNQCFWAGGVRGHFPKGLGGREDEWCDRNMVMRSAQYHLDLKECRYEEYMGLFDSYKMFLHLNGTGRLCKRFFEGLSRDCLMMLEKTDLDVYSGFNGRNIPIDSLFSPHCVFTTGEELVYKVWQLRTNPWLYDEAKERQRKVVDKYFKKEFVRGVVEKNLLRIKR